MNTNSFIKISDSLTLGEWYNIPTGCWAKKNINTLVIEIDASKVYLYPNAINTFTVFFTESLFFLNEIFRSTLQNEFDFLNHNQVDEAKEFIDNFLIRMSKIKYFT